MARTGKIARLKKVHRDQVNTMIRDNASAETVARFIGKLKAAGEVDADGNEIEIPNDQNLTNWREGGYQDWLKERQRLDEMREKREFALDIVRENEGGKIHEAGLNLAASQIFELLQDFDVGTLKEQLASDPENYSKVISALARISKEALGFEKYRELVAESKRKIEAAMNEGRSKGGISAETIEKIERELKLL